MIFKKPANKKAYVRRFFNGFLRIGYQDDLPQLDKSRIMIVNALSMVMLAVGFGFMLGLYWSGSQSWYFIGLALPIYSCVLYINRMKRYKLAQYLLYFTSLSLLTLLCFTNRRVGAEFGLITVACSVPLMSKKNSEVFALFILTFLAFMSYKVYDYLQPFVPDPSINYLFASTIALNISVTAILIETYLFRKMVVNYSQSLWRKNIELNDTIESRSEVEAALEKKNDELSKLTDQLSWIVKQKTLELQTYIDAINVNICSSIIDLDGDFIKVNEPFLKLSGYMADELIGKNIRMLDSEYHNSLYQQMQTCLESGKTWRGEVKNVDKQGSIFWTDQMIIPMKIRGDQISYFLMLAFPITQRKLNEESRDKTLRMLENIAFQTSHKIRGPLARIQGLMSLVQKDMIETSELKTIINNLVTCSSELNLATSDLVNFVIENQNFMEEDSHEITVESVENSRTLFEPNEANELVESNDLTI